MRKWVERQYAAFEQHYGFHDWCNHPFSRATRDTYRHVSYVQESDVCAFLGLSVWCFRHLIGKSIQHHRAPIDAYTLAIASDEVLYQWTAFDGLLNVPGLLSHRHRTKVTALRDRLYTMQCGTDIRYRDETYEELLARNEREMRQSDRRVNRFITKMEQKSPGWHARQQHLAQAIFQEFHAILEGQTTIIDMLPSTRLLGEQHTYGEH